MAPKYLTDLSVESIDVCPEGANQEAFINLFKSKGERAALNEQRVKELFSKLGKALGMATKEDVNDPEQVEDETSKPKEEMCKAKQESMQESMQEEIVKAKEEVNKAKEEVAELKKELAMQTLIRETEKYRAVGKDPVKLAKSLLIMDEAVRKEYVGVLDELLHQHEMFNESALFTEIGKGGRGMVTNDTVSKIEAIAAEIHKAKPEIDLVQAKAQAWVEHPELVSEYERGVR